MEPKTITSPIDLSSLQTGSTFTRSTRNFDFSVQKGETVAVQGITNGVKHAIIIDVEGEGKNFSTFELL